MKNQSHQYPFTHDTNGSEMTENHSCTRKDKILKPHVKDFSTIFKFAIRPLPFNLFNYFQKVVNNTLLK